MNQRISPAPASGNGPGSGVGMGEPGGCDGEGGSGGEYGGGSEGGVGEGDGDDVGGGAGCEGELGVGEGPDEVTQQRIGGARGMNPPEPGGAGCGAGPEARSRTGAVLPGQIGEPDRGTAVSSGRSGTTGVLRRRSVGSEVDVGVAGISESRLPQRVRAR